MAKALKILLLVIGSLVLVVGVILGFLAIQFNKHENESKKVLAQEVSVLPIPATCQEKSRTYTLGGVDTNSSWHVVYACNTTGGPAYDHIVNGLKAKGYQVQDDYSVPGPETKSIFYAFTYKNPSFKVDYQFIPLSRTDVGSPDALKTTPLTEMSISIYRAKRSY